MPDLFQGSQEQGLQPFVKPVTFLYSKGANPGSGAAIEQAAAKLGDVALSYQKQEAENEVRGMQVKAAQIRLAAQGDIQNAIANGTPDDLANIQQKYQGQLQQLGAGAKYLAGQQAAQIYGDDAQGKINADVFQGQAHQYGVIAKTQANTYGNTLAGIVTNDPTQLNDAENKIDVFSQSLKGIGAEGQKAIATEMKQNVNYAAASALITNNPIAAEKMLSAGKLFLTADQRSVLISKAQTQQRLDQESVMMNMRVKMMKQDMANQEAVKGYIGKMANGQPFDLTELSQDPALTYEGVENLYNFSAKVREQGFNAASMSDPSTVTSIMHRMSLPPEDPQAITSENIAQQLQPLVRAQKLSVPDLAKFEDLEDKLKKGDPDYQHLMTIVRASRGAYANQFGSLDPDADSYAFLNFALNKYGQYQSQNKDIGKTLLNPKSPEYIGSHENLLAARAQIGQGAVPPANAGLPHVAAEADIGKLGLKPGAKFIGPDNQVHTVPGKPESAATPAKVDTTVNNNFPAGKGPLTGPAPKGQYQWKSPYGDGLPIGLPAMMQPNG